MKYLLDGCSRFTGCHLQLELEAVTADEAIERATRLGLVQVEARSMPVPRCGGSKCPNCDDNSARSPQPQHPRLRSA